MEGVSKCQHFVPVRVFHHRKVFRIAVRADSLKHEKLQFLFLALKTFFPPNSSSSAPCHTVFLNRSRIVIMMIIIIVSNKQDDVIKKF